MTRFVIPSLAWLVRGVNMVSSFRNLLLARGAREVHLNDPPPESHITPPGQPFALPLLAAVAKQILDKRRRPCGKPKNWCLSGRKGHPGRANDILRQSFSPEDATTIQRRKMQQLTYWPHTQKKEKELGMTLGPFPSRAACGRRRLPTGRNRHWRTRQQVRRASTKNPSLSSTTPSVATERQRASSRQSRNGARQARRCAPGQLTS